MTAGLIPAASAYYSDADASADYYSAAVRLQDLGIISGYDDGSFRPDNRITRAEFTKMVICMMDKEKDAAASASVSGFYDVPSGSWSAPYITYAVSRDILSGYSDGSFGPDKTISFSEAITILMRTLGYSESDVGYYWPNNYMNAASSLGITAGMDYDYSAQLTRATAAILIDRAIFAKPSSADGKTDTYLETVGYTVLDDALILDNDPLSSNVIILSGNLKLNNADTYLSRTQLSCETGSTFSHAVIDKNGYLAAVKEYDGNTGLASMSATVNRLTGNTIEYTTSDGRKGTYKPDDTFITYCNYSKMTFAQAKSYITNGADITFYGLSDGLWNIAVLGNGDDIDPVRASHAYTLSSDSLEGTPINKTNLTIYRDGEAAVLSDIAADDVVYYNTKTNVMDVYSKKVTGIYYAASPSKAYVESITVGGKQYTIGCSAATGKLDASAGSFAIGDKITLLLGKNDEIAFVTDNASGFDYYEYGVLISTSTKEATQGSNEGNTENVAEIFMTDGEIHEITVDKQYRDNYGDMMRISYTGGVAKLTSVNTSNSSDYEGKISIDNRTIGNRYVLKDAAVIQLNSDIHSDSIECELLDFDNLTSSSVTSDNIINVITANKFGDIAIIYVKDLESTYQYGVIGGFTRSGDDTLTGYKIFSDSVLNTYSLNNMSKITTSVGSGVGFKVSGGQLKKITALTEVSSASAITAVEGSRIMLGKKIFKLAPEVQIADVTDTSNIRSITIDELASAKNITSVKLYSDKLLSENGYIRVIAVKTSK